MSLSKYFKDSSSFKREKIVKSGSPDISGWQSNSKAAPTPFEPGKLSVADARREQPVNRQSQNEQDQGVSEQTISPSQPIQTPEPSSSLDLSNYISITEAEEKAQTMYQQGIQDGLSKASEDYGSATIALATSCEQLDSIRETIIGNSTNELIEFALLIAEKIIRISLKEQDQTIVATVEEALLRAVKSDEFTVFIHPDDYETISLKSNDLISGVSGLSSIVLKTDPTIEKGGAKIESENCIIDATIVSQFDAIREELNMAK